MIIDIHTHNFAGSAEAVISSTAQYGIDRFVLLGDVLRYGELPAPDEVRKINDETLSYVRRTPERSRGFCFLNPANPPETVIAEARRCLEMAEFTGIKLEISVNVRSPQMAPVMEILEEFDMPLLQHCWYKTVNKYPGESDPSDVACLARRYPKNKIIMAHLCGCRERGVEDIADCPNVFVDTSGAQPEAGFIEYAVKRIGAKRLLYGSDAPCRDFGCQLAKVREAAISESDRELILGKNAEGLLSW
jgi:predicted TIM-barrel fold metal-dependent hydrolase